MACVVWEGRVSRKEYMRELFNAKLCFSPFGYGEMCWRDIEAILAGAVLIKPRMDHLETLPELYDPGVTYLPSRWDFTDLADIVENAGKDLEALEVIAMEATNRVTNFLKAQQFVDHMYNLMNTNENEFSNA